MSVINFVEADHPREPSGSDEGGQFAESGGTDYHSKVEDKNVKSSTEAKLTDEQSEALDTYMGGMHADLNKELRKDDPEQSSNFPYEIEHLDKALKKGGIIQDTTVYRGVQGDFAKSLAALRPGDILQDKGYVSTSADLKTATDFSSGGVLISIKLSKGSKALGLWAGGEAEVLLPRGSKFKVVSNVGGKLSLEKIERGKK